MKKTTYREILKLAGPLILTMSGHMLMQFVDTLFLSWYSADAMAAVVPAGMAFWMLICAFHGCASYTSTLVSQYAGAGRADMASSTVWQGIYFSLLTGTVLVVCSMFARPVFTLIGHAPAVLEYEITYFGILCLSAPVMLLGGAVTGFFAGLHKPMIIFIAQCAGALVNILLDWLLIFGYLGLPEMGVAGAGIGVVAGQAAIFFVLAGVFLRPSLRKQFQTWSMRKFDRELTKRLIRFGFPNGMRYLIEMTAWTAFLFFIGRLGTVELTATNIAWRINGLAFFPIIGLSQAVGILVGNAQGRKDPADSVRVTVKGMIVSQAWMILAAVVFVSAPWPLYRMFFNSGGMTEEMFTHIVELGTILLRMVALYCLMDAFNIVILTTLQSAGDTKWTFTVAFFAHVIFIFALILADVNHTGLFTQWAIATTFVILQALVWLGRFFSGNWKFIQVIENN